MQFTVDIDSIPIVNEEGDSFASRIQVDVSLNRGELKVELWSLCEDRCINMQELTIREQDRILKMASDRLC